MNALRNYINSVKPNFIGDGKYSKWFPLFDAVENFIFSTQTKTSNPVHIRDAVDIQKIMVIVWLSKKSSAGQRRAAVLRPNR